MGVPAKVNLAEVRFGYAHNLKTKGSPKRALGVVQTWESNVSLMSKQTASSDPALSCSLK